MIIVGTMTKTNNIITLLVAVCVAISCIKEEQPTGIMVSGDQMTFTAVAAGHTNTVIENGGNVYWFPQEEIKIFYDSNSGKFTSTNKEPAAQVDFNGSIDGLDASIDVSVMNDYFWAVYPYSQDSSFDGSSVTVGVQSVQIGKAGSFSPGAFPSIARSKRMPLSFRNLCGGIRFSVNNYDIQRVVFKGNNNETLAGTFKVGMDQNNQPVILSILDEVKEVTVTAPFGECFVPGVNYFIALRPVMLSKGFTMTYEGESGSVEYVHDTALELNSSVFAVLDGKDGPGPAPVLMYGSNCYLINKYGVASFDARLKGNSVEPVGEIASAEVIWESFGNNIKPLAGDVISNVSVEGTVVKFTATGNDGNAVIAVKNASGDILWSWHIWVCRDYDPEATAQVYNSQELLFTGPHTAMDRNLGATSATKGDANALGLLYQWGRKDPFLGSQSISSPIAAESTIDWPSAVASDANNGTIDFVVKHPTTFVTGNSINYDWYYSGSYATDNTRWVSNKGMYDPCPQGWNVPDGGQGGLWSTAFGSSSRFVSELWDDINKGMDFGGVLGKSDNIWYPAAGYINSTNGALYSVGCDGYSWSCTPNSVNASSLYFSNNGYVFPTINYNHAYGRPVRCVKPKEREPINLSINGTANCYLVDSYGMCRFDARYKGNTLEQVGEIASAEVLWESLGGYYPDPWVGIVVKDVTIKNDMVQFYAGANGNAVIAVKDAAGNILWSWHIWVCRDYDPEATAQVYYNDAGTVMDRNLGATTKWITNNESLGLLYQWGRKDPFLGSSEPNRSTRSLSTITWPSAVESDANNGTIDFVTKHPTTFVKGNELNNDWYYTGDDSTDNTRWNSDKGMYDPCPPGWKVPDGGPEGLWTKAANSLEEITGKVGNYFLNFAGLLGDAEDILYPVSGWLNPYMDGALSMTGHTGDYWSCSPDDNWAHEFGIYYTSQNNSLTWCGQERAFGLCIRCVKE